MKKIASMARVEYRVSKSITPEPRNETERTMTNILKLAGMLVVLAAVAIFAVVPAAQSATYSTPYYSINYYNSAQYGWARNLAPYLNRSFWAAKTTIGYDARIGKMNIYFKWSSGGANGSMNGGYQNIFLNTRLFTSYNKWGSVVAHESAHVLFYNYTKAHLWNSKLLHYRTFFTEALSWYAGDYVYNYNKYTRSTAYSQIRADLKYYQRKTGITMSWYHSGYYYRYGSGNKLNQAIWSLKAAGWFLTNGRLTSSNYYLQKTLYTMRVYSSYSGSYLRSSNFSTAQSYFEKTFKYGYGRYANAGWIYTGSSNGAYKSTTYLYGIFWNYFYK